MAKALSAQTEANLTLGKVNRKITVLLNSINITSYCLTYSYGFNTDFSIASLDVDLLNNDGLFSAGGESEVHLDDKIVVTEAFHGSSDIFTNFTGYVRQRRKNKSAQGNMISLNCLDYLIKLEDTDLEKKFEATKIVVTNETLTPNPLESPNATLSQIYNFANQNIAQKPKPIFQVFEAYTGLTSDLDSGYEVYYETGQVHFGTAFNFTGYPIRVDYSYYPKSLHVEEIIEDIFCEVDGYSNYLFGETSAADVVTNHLTETYLNVEGTSIDTLVPNLTTQSITIESALTIAAIAGATYITVADTTGFPAAGTGDINGETFTWTSKTATTLVGAVTSAHGTNSYANYKASYVAGQVWYTAYSNHVTTLVSGNFTVPGGTINYIDKRQGRIILATAISALATVTCNIDYSFKTIQATGIQISDIDYLFRKDKTRLDALKKLQEVLPPNYVFQTIGNEKIWGRFLTQKATEDFTLKCITSLDYSEDTSIYTRTRFYGKNENPVNICWQPGLAELVTGETFTATVNNQELTWKRKEGGWQVYGVGSSIGKILTSTFQPRCRVNGVLIDDEDHEVLFQPASAKLGGRERDNGPMTSSDTWMYGNEGIRDTFGGGKSNSPTNLWIVWSFAHYNINRNHKIIVYKSNGGINMALAPQSPDGSIPANCSTTLGDGTGRAMDYERGCYTWGPMSTSDIGTEPDIENVSSASYWIHWSSSYLKVNLDKGEFYISNAIISDEAKLQVSVTADFEYQSIVESVLNGFYIKDGRWDTQAQTMYLAKPPAGFIFIRLDLGDLYKMQIIDLVAGFFRPEADSKIRLDMTNTYTLQYSLDNITYYDVCEKARKFRLAAGEAISFELEDLGEDFKARYLQIKIDEMSQVTYLDGCWVAAITDLACYSQSVLIGEAKLTPWTGLSSIATLGASTINVDDTSTFVSSGTAYIEDDAFSYTGKSATTFTGCTDVTTHAAGSRVSQELESKGADTTLTEVCAAAATTLTVDSTLNFAAKGTAYVEEDAFTYTGLTDTTFTGCSGLLAHGKFAQVIQSPVLYDTEYLLKMKDKVYKDTAINDFLSTQKKANDRAYNWLREFIKDHSKCTTTVLYAPHLRPGMTVKVVDAVNNIDARYFIEALNIKASSADHPTNLVLARYP